MGFQDEMSQYDDDAAAGVKSGPSMLPDGKHQTQVSEFRLEEREDAWVVVAKFQNQAGSVRKWYDLSREVPRSILLGDAQMMGYEGALSEIDQWIAEENPIGCICEINVVTKPGDERDFTNVYLNRVLGKTELQDFGSPESGGSEFVPTGADDDIPF